MNTVDDLYLSVRFEDPVKPVPRELAHGGIHAAFEDFFDRGASTSSAFERLERQIPELQLDQGFVGSACGLARRIKQPSEEVLAQLRRVCEEDGNIAIGTTVELFGED